jgi:cell division protein FtsN
MKTPRYRTHSVIVGAAMMVALAATVSGCAKGTNQQSPSSTTTTMTSSSSSPSPSPSPTDVSPSPTEKDINPTGGNLFTPPVTAPPAPTVQGGQHHGLNGVP